ncbi:MAG: M56 family metallopeptidase, partial [Verrucomicrobiota bacterium]
RFPSRSIFLTAGRLRRSGASGDFCSTGTRAAFRLRVPRLGLLMYHARVAMGVPRWTELVVSHHFTSAAVFGLKRPVILLPSSMADTFSDRELVHIFMHEMAHIRRGDHRWFILLDIITALHWFNPLVWVGIQRFRADREMICDEMVMQQFDRAEHMEYGHTLIRLVQQFVAPTPLQTGSVPVVRHKNEVRRRMAMIVNAHKPGRIVRGICSVTFMVFCLTTFTTAEGRVDVQPQDPEPRRPRLETPAAPGPPAIRLKAPPNHKKAKAERKETRKYEPVDEEYRWRRIEELNMELRALEADVERKLMASKKKP